MANLLTDIDRSWAGDLGLGSIPGGLMTISARARVERVGIATIPTAAGTVQMQIIVPFIATLAAVRVAFKDALAANDTNFVTFSLLNRLTTGLGTLDLLATTAVNTTKVTGGSAIVAYGRRTLTVHPSNSLVLNAGDVLSFQVTGTGTLANTLTEGTAHFILDAQG